MATNSRAAASAITSSLRSAEDPDRAASGKRYLKSDLEHLGVNLPSIRKVAAGFINARPQLARPELLEVVAELWARPIHECRMAAVELLIKRGGLLEFRDVRYLEKMIRESKTWALVDSLAVTVAGALVRRFPEMHEVLDRWAGDPDFWVRRSALLALLKPLRDGGGDFERFGRYADSMLEEKEFFIRKAIGWVLRETSKKQPRLVYEWMLPRAASASGITVREAIKYLPERQAGRILAASKRT